MNRHHANLAVAHRTQRRGAISRTAGGLGLLITTLVILAGCGTSGGGAVTAPYIAPARVASLGGFQPSGPVVAGRPTLLSFTSQQASGKPLTSYRTCCEPHAGVVPTVSPSPSSYQGHTPRAPTRSAVTTASAYPGRRATAGLAGRPTPVGSR